MKIDDFKDYKPVPGKPGQFLVWGRPYTVEPLLKLFTEQFGDEWANDIDEVMYLLMLLVSTGDLNEINLQDTHRLFYLLRLLRDAFKKTPLSENNLSNQNKQPHATR